jgi:hypothetical protein
MTTIIFIENATPFSYQIFDHDGHRFGTATANGYYGMKLNYSPTFEKQYLFQDGTNMFTMWLGRDGTISRIYQNNQVHLEVKPEEYHHRAEIFPPPLKTSNQVTNKSHMQGKLHNKLYITPIDNIYARIIPILAKPTPDRALRLDFV